MKQTGVEYLVSKLPLGVKEAIMFDINQAKEIEREQIIYAFHIGNETKCNVDNVEQLGEEYYNENYKKTQL